MSAPLAGLDALAVVGFTIDAGGRAAAPAVPAAEKSAAGLARRTRRQAALRALYAHGRQHAPAADQRRFAPASPPARATSRWRSARSSWARCASGWPAAVRLRRLRGRPRRARAGTLRRRPPRRHAAGGAALAERADQHLPAVRERLPRPPGPQPRRPPGAAGRAVRAFHQGRGRQSRRLVSDRAQRRGADHGQRPATA